MAIPTIADAAGVLVQGSFLALACTGDVTEVDTSDGTEFISDEGTRSVFYTPSVVKSWKISSQVPASWAESCDLMRAHIYGYGPWWFYNPRSAALNGLRSGFSGDPASYLDHDGTLVPMFSGAGPLTSGKAVVMGGKTITASVLVSGPCTVKLIVDGMATPGAASAQSVNVSGVNRVTVTLENLPEFSTTAYIQVEPSADGELFMAGWPQIVTGTEPGEMRAPQGMGMVTLAWGERSWNRLAPRDGSELVSVEFTATEVGSYE